MTEDTTYYAIFTQEENPTYTVNWANYDGTILESDSGYYAGDVPADYAGETPYRDNDGETYYDFIGWSKTQGSTAAEAITAIGSADETYYAVFAPTTATKRFVVMDFNMIAPVGTNVENCKFKALQEQEGAFSLQSGVLRYQLDTTKIGVSAGVLTFNGGDTVAFKGQFVGDAVKWNKAVIIPANNIYFDDDLESVTLSGDNDHGYDASVPNASVTPAEGEANGESYRTITFSFKGTGVDVYATTDADAATSSRLPPDQASAAPAIRASAPAHTLSVASRMSGTVITASVT